MACVYVSAVSTSNLCLPCLPNQQSFRSAVYLNAEMWHTCEEEIAIYSIPRLLVLLIAEFQGCNTKI